MQDEYKGRAWYHPGHNKIYGGAIGTYRGGILTDVSEIEAKNVLAELLGLARPLYKLDDCVTKIAAPELILNVDTETVGNGSENVQPLEESTIRSKSFSRTNFECVLNEAHIVVEDRAAMKASHDVLRLNIEDSAREIARMRNSQIATVLHTATEVATDAGWNGMTSGVSDHNPMELIGTLLTTIQCNGYDPDYMAVDPADWSNFLGNTHISRLVQAGLLNVGANPTVTLPGWPNVKVLVDCALTAGKGIVGSKRAIILAEGPTEAVRYRNELKRYTGYIIRQYIQPQIVIAGAIREMTDIVD